MIGQFGVGFYAVFAAAERVVVATRSFKPDAQAVRWESTGDDTYTVAPAEQTARGTTVTVYLKSDAQELAQPVMCKNSICCVYVSPNTFRLLFCWTKFSHITGITVLRTPLQAPRANAICERLLGSVWCECLDHILVMSAAHLRRILTEYVTYFNCARLHQGIDQRVPEPEEGQRSASGETGNVVSFPVLGGLHHAYQRAA
jgi:hypothetical protein